jgi:hypothetical protein
MFFLAISFGTLEYSKTPNALTQQTAHSRVHKHNKIVHRELSEETWLNTRFSKG